MATDFVLSSAGVTSGQPLPRRHTCDGENLSPALSWSGAPEGTQALALILDDPDAPRGTFTHWIAYDIPPEFNGRTLAEGMRFAEADGVLEGSNDFGRAGYGGPCPPPGSTHTYVFRLYALSAPLGLKPGASRRQVSQAMEGRVLAEANLYAPYTRPQRR